MGAVVIERTVSLAASPAAVWPLLTDTERTNRLVVGAVTYRPIEPGHGSSARYVAETRAAGFALEYEEAPFEWTVNERFSVRRRMRSGPLTEYTYGIALMPEGNGTRLTMRLELALRHWFLRPIAVVEGTRIVRQMIALAARLDAHVVAGERSPYAEPKADTDVMRLAEAATQLEKRGIDRAVLDVVVEIVRDAPDADVVRIRPFELAHTRGVDGRETLRALLHAVSVGLVELRWALVCPSCQTASNHVDNLAELTDAGHCQLCDITYELDLSRAVEATFRPHPRVRKVDDRLFCIGGPWRTPHVLVQANVESESSRTLAAPREAGRFRIFARGGAVASLVVAEGEGNEPTEAAVRLAEGRLVPAEIAVAKGGTVTVENAGPESLHVKIERLGYASLAATAHDVTTMAEFRRLFSKDLLKPKTPLRVTSATILFSDLTGSTALYSKAGDAAAFRLVDDHFDVLRRAIGEHRGVVVKTMGDAVMAAFIEPETAVRGAMACLRAFEVLRRTHPHGRDTGLKLGLFNGPCYVVTANETIDYFGQTVNCASRVQHLAATSEIVFTTDLFEQLPANLRAELELVESLEARVKGVAEALRLVRVRVVDAAPDPRYADAVGGAPVDR